MEEIRRSPVELGSLFHYLQGFIHPRWCRISEPSTVFLTSFSKPQLFGAFQRRGCFCPFVHHPKSVQDAQPCPDLLPRLSECPKPNYCSCRQMAFFFERKLPGRKQQNYMHPFEEITANMPNAHGSNVEPWGS